MQQFIFYYSLNTIHWLESRSLLILVAGLNLITVFSTTHSLMISFGTSKPIWLMLLFIRMPSLSNDALTASFSCVYITLQIGRTLKFKQIMSHCVITLWDSRQISENEIRVILRSFDCHLFKCKGQEWRALYTWIKRTFTLDNKGADFVVIVAYFGYTLHSRLPRSDSSTGGTATWS